MSVERGIQKKMASSGKGSDAEPGISWALIELITSPRLRLLMFYRRNIKCLEAFFSGASLERYPASQNVVSAREANGRGQHQHKLHWILMMMAATLLLWLELLILLNIRPSTLSIDINNAEKWLPPLPPSLSPVSAQLNWLVSVN